MDDFTMDLIYRSRWVLIIMGWMWFGLGAVWMAMFLALDVPATILFHIIFDTCFGLAHLWLANKAKKWKNKS